MRIWIFVSVLVTLIAVASWEMPSLFKQNSGKEFLIFILLTGVILAISAIQAMNITLPNPFDILTLVFKPLTDIIELFTK